VVVGPEDPLVDGLADQLRTDGVPTYGPGARGARLEASKAFSKGLMSDAAIPTAAFGSFTAANDAKDYARARFDSGRQVAVKANGNALGKGVIVCDSIDEAIEAIDRMMIDNAFGEAGQTVVVEDRLMGREFSLLTMISDDDFYSLPVCQDHKRAFDDDLGPNTGGMGTYSPVHWVDQDLVRETEQRVVVPTLNALRERGIAYRGTLFSGLMFDQDELYCLEFNVRFGDPEMQTLAFRLGEGFLQALDDCAHGRPITRPEIKGNAAITVVVASGGYPGDYKRGLPITIGALQEGVKLFHAGTKENEGRLVTNGGRVFGVSAEANSFEEARARAYEACSAVCFEGAFYRRDIGAGA
jgi:phosphoribosylamine--glycine ligase